MTPERGDAAGSPASAAPLDALRAVLGDRSGWLVGGAVRDRLLGRATGDVDVAVPGDPRGVARALARATGAAAFPLSEAFGAWRVAGPARAWQVDLVALRDGDLHADLAARDFTINAMAAPLAHPDAVVDPFGGREDLAARRLRMVAERALADDPLRALRAARLATELELVVESATATAVARRAGGLAGVAEERVWGELRRIVASPRVREGVGLLEALGVAPVLLPELEALRGVTQSAYHHRDVHGHTLEVLEWAVTLEGDPAACGLERHAGEVRAWLAAPLAEGLTRSAGLRLGALLHDVAKPQTRVEIGGRIGFPGHDAVGAGVAAGILRRWRAAERIAAYVAAVTRFHLDLGFLVHQGPLEARTAWRYLRRTAPHGIDVTLLTVADRLATRGRNAGAAIAAHLDLAATMLDHAFALEREGRRAPLVRGDELARALGLAPGPALGELLARLEEDRYAGEIATPEDAIRHARALASGG